MVRAKQACPKRSASIEEQTMLILKKLDDAEFDQYMDTYLEKPMVRYIIDGHRVKKAFAMYIVCGMARAKVDLTSFVSLKNCTREDVDCADELMVEVSDFRLSEAQERSH